MNSSQGLNHFITTSIQNEHTANLSPEEELSRKDTAGSNVKAASTISPTDGCLAEDRQFPAEDNTKGLSNERQLCDARTRPFEGKV